MMPALEGSHGLLAAGLLAEDQLAELAIQLALKTAASNTSQ